MSVNIDIEILKTICDKEIKNFNIMENGHILIEYEDHIYRLINYEDYEDYRKMEFRDNQLNKIISK